MIFRDFCGFLGGLGGDIFVAVLFGSIFWVAGTVIGGGVLGYFGVFGLIAVVIGSGGDKAS